MSEYLFLYGTLLPGDATDESSRIVSRLKRVGSATIRGRLYDFGEYPGAVLDRTAKSSIKGELFELPNDDSALKALDDYEEFNRTDRKNSLFVRTRTVATLQGGRQLNAWVYVYNRNPGSARQIASGDYSKSRAA
jgi:gamma-glutamylcyclotransferase (GGCT)/AIG2-like uncharacterized protein YtfP